MVNECRCTKHEGCDPCVHDGLRYRDALEHIAGLRAKPSAFPDNAIAIAIAALHKEPK